MAYTFSKKMRATILILTLVLWAGFASAFETPREFARRFYAAHRTWPIRGVPSTRHEDIVSPFLGIELIQAFCRVNLHRRLEAKQFDPANPMKPRWCAEGDVFCDNWEGITHYSIGKAMLRNGRWVVEAHLEYVENTKSYPWTDRLVLDRAGEDWVVSDIEYGRGGSLLPLILKELTDADCEIRKPAANKEQKSGESGPRD